MKAITTSRQAMELIQPYFDELEHEEVWILVTGNLRPIVPIRVETGTRSSVELCIKKIAKLAILNDGDGVILYHNHPSNDPMPSSADIKQTEHLKNALSTLDISLIDHIIFTEDKFFSFADDETSNIN